MCITECFARMLPYCPQNYVINQNLELYGSEGFAHFHNQNSHFTTWKWQTTDFNYIRQGPFSFKRQTEFRAYGSA